PAIASSARSAAIPQAPQSTALRTKPHAVYFDAHARALRRGVFVRIALAAELKLVHRRRTRSSARITVTRSALRIRATQGTAHRLWPIRHVRGASQARGRRLIIAGRNFSARHVLAPETLVALGVTHLALRQTMRLCVSPAAAITFAAAVLANRHHAHARRVSPLTRRGVVITTQGANPFGHLAAQVVCVETQLVALTVRRPFT